MTANESGDPNACKSPATERVDGPQQRTDLSAGCLLYVAKADSDDRGQSLRLQSGEALIGSDSSCDLVLHDRAVSRQHLRIAVQADGIAVEDLGSTNGTLYLDQQVRELLLTTGARLMLGRCAVDILPLSEHDPARVSTRDRYGEILGTSTTMRRLRRSSGTSPLMRFCAKPSTMS